MSRKIPTLGQVASYSLSYVQWLMMGKPRRSPEQIVANLKICESCDELQGGFCVQCECPIGEDEDKLVWPHTSCPLQKWLAEVQQPNE